MATEHKITATERAAFEGLLVLGASRDPNFNAHGWRTKFENDPHAAVPMLVSILPADIRANLESDGQGGRREVLFRGVAR